VSTQQPGFDPYGRPAWDESDVQDAPPVGAAPDAFGHPGGSLHVPPPRVPASRFGSAPSGYAVAGYGQAGYGQAHGSSPYGTPAYGGPAYGTPAYGGSAYGGPVYGGPVYGTPAYGGSAYGGPVYGPRADLAGWGRRFLALNIDSLIMLGPYLAAYVVAIATAPPPGPSGEQPLSPAGGFALVLGFVWYVGSWIVNRIVLQGRTGQSWGKRALGIRLVGQQSGLPIGAARSFAREVAHYVDGIFYLGYLWPLWDAHRQTFADKILTTVVVRD
jgi:uncharacterized RDD family membrane protein YckC